MRQQADFQILYDGPALQSHEMDVRDLAPALLAIGDLLEETNKVHYGDIAAVQVNVKGSFETGSFHVYFSLVQSLAAQLSMFMNSPEGITTVDLLSLLGLNAQNGFGLLPLMIWLKGRKIRNVTKISQERSVVEVDKDEKEVENKVLDLYRNLKVRKSLDIIISKPLSRSGIEEFAIKYKEEEFITVKKSEGEYFKAPESIEEVLKDAVQEVYLKAVSIAFVDDNKWRFTNGNVTFFAAVKDEKFLKNVQDGKHSFSKDDIFQVKLREKQWIAETGIKSEYEIVEVMSHRPARPQIKLPFETVQEDI